MDVGHSRWIPTSSLRRPPPDLLTLCPPLASAASIDNLAPKRKPGDKEEDLTDGWGEDFVELFMELLQGATTVLLDARKMSFDGFKVDLLVTGKNGVFGAFSVRDSLILSGNRSMKA